MSDPLPPDGSLERWAWDYVTTTDLAHKLAPPPAPDDTEERPLPRVLAAPGRPAALEVVTRAEKSPSANALRATEARCRLVHTFLHHELQAAELFAWALLAFPEAPAPFRKGLVAVLRDELRHMEMYREYLDARGFAFGAWPVRDWFWSRVPRVTTAAGFCAVMGMGLEAGNLDHTARFAQRFRDAGDPEGARIQELVGEEEIPHVRLGVHWFKRFTGDLAYARWTSLLPEPLSPWMMKGPSLAREMRLRAGMDDAFLDALDAARLEAR